MYLEIQGAQCFLTLTVFKGAWRSRMSRKMWLKKCILSSTSSKMSSTDHGTMDRSLLKSEVEKCLKERLETVLGGNFGEGQLISRRMGRWSEIEAPRTAELEIGTSGEARKRSRIEQRSSEIRVG
jgi:hypothetical protein